MEINLIKIRNKEFVLSVGDRIMSNREGHYMYFPSTRKNKELIPISNYTRLNYVVVTKKYHNLIDNATNLKLVKHTPHENQHLRHKEWVVESVSEVVKEEKELGDVFCITLDSNGFKIASKAIVKNTDKQIVLENYLGEKYLTTLSKKHDMNSISYNYDRLYVYCLIDDIDDYRDEMYVTYKKKLNGELAKAKELLDTFNSNLEKEGYEN